MTDTDDKAANRRRNLSLGLPPSGRAIGRARDPFHEGEAAARARRVRSLAIALGLVFFVLLIFAVSILRLSSNANLAAQAAGTAPPPALAAAHGS